MKIIKLIKETKGIRFFLAISLYILSGLTRDKLLFVLGTLIFYGFNIIEIINRIYLKRKK